MKVSCANNDTNIFENLYHHNAHIRTEAVAYLVQNFKKINLDNNESSDILKLTISERLSDDNPNVMLEVLNIEASQLVQLIGADELVAKLSKALMKYWKSPEKWNSVHHRALRLLTTSGVYQCSDPNIVLISILPFLFPSTEEQVASYKAIKNSDYGKSFDFIKRLPKSIDDLSEFSIIVLESLTKSKNLPTSESLLTTIQNLLLENQKTGSISVQFSFLLFTTTRVIEVSQKADFSLQVLRVVKEVLVKRKLQLVDGVITDTSLLGSQEIPMQAVTSLLQMMIESTPFNGPAINFSQQDDEMKLKLEMFQFLVEKFFAADAKSALRPLVNSVIKTLLGAICNGDHLTKLQFFSQFCASHAVYQDINGTSLQLQIRSMRLLNHVLDSNQEHSKDYSKQFFQNILIALSAEQPIIREFGMQIVETLHEQKIPACWKFVFEKLQSRKSEILMDSEQLSLILFLITSKKSSAHAKQVIDSITSEIQNPETFDYIQSSLLLILKHLNDKKVLEVMSLVALKMIEANGDDVNRFDDFQSLIVKLVLMKINHGTIAALWNLATKSLECHRLLYDDDGKYLTPSILVLKSIDEEIFATVHPDRRLEIFQKIVKCSMEDHPRIVQAAQKVFSNMNLDCKVVKTMLLKMPKLEQQRIGKKKAAPAGEVHANPLTSDDWKFGVTLLELLQNKTKGLTNQHELIPVLFEVLDNCLRSSAESNVEYVRQIVLSLLLMICQKVSPDGKAHRAVGIQDGMLKTELVIKCIKESENPQTHHHSCCFLLNSR